MKIGIDFGNKTFSAMRVVQGNVEPIPNISPYLYGQSQEACPAIFKQQQAEWKLAKAVDEQTITHAVTAKNEAQLTAMFQSILQTILMNDPGNALEEIVVACPKDEAERIILQRSMENAHRDGRVECLDEDIAAIFGSTLYDSIAQTVGTTRTILVLDGKVNTLCASIYTITVVQQQGIHMHITQLSEAKFDALSGEQIEHMLAARAQEIAAQAGVLPMDEIAPHEWRRFVDYLKAQFLVDATPFIAGDFIFENGYEWEEPAELASAQMYEVFKGHPYTIGGQRETRHIEEDLQQAIHVLCDDSDITVNEIESIVLAGGTLRLPFWQQLMKQLFQHATVAPLPETISELGIIGRGCAKYIEWKEAHQFTYSVKKQTGAYIGIALHEAGSVSFKPLLANQNVATSGTLLLRIEPDQPFVISVYEGPQTSDLSKCTKRQTVRILHQTLQQLLPLNHVAFRFIAEGDRLFYEINHPYTDERLLKGEISHDNRTAQSQLND